MTATKADRTPYLPQEPDLAAPLRLFCFHHAGGSASVFSGWQRALGDAVSVVPVQLPGRERRFDEPRIRHLPELVNALDAQLDPWLRQPFVTYGHSLGGLVSYALTRQRAAAGRSIPERLMVGAFPAPHRRHALVDADRLDDEEFARRLVDLGGISPTLRAYPDWLRAAASLARDDLALGLNHGIEAFEPLPCPVDVFTGDRDPLMRENDIDEWAQHTRASFSIQRVPGGHFFPWDSPALFLELLGSAIAHTGTRRASVA
ncbi:thioesterase II family protein [Streptomyces litchfieldiae]|uniref:Alpha/beta fold hydrolase n=1 Tax=Streptomyces litchfieldiae TaxID=3075543 RepID=A0ABU2N0A6_9ACTN|nr:alpha/beta fold hydrolase [Streptomyces sp. DSM 44938]MDT0347330.1 alpha/beta fold hydrolase [Streptomyces sp. DSM 44938]